MGQENVRTGKHFVEKTGQNQRGERQVSEAGGWVQSWGHRRGRSEETRQEDKVAPGQGGEPSYEEGEPRSSPCLARTPPFQAFSTSHPH